MKPQLLITSLLFLSVLNGRAQTTSPTPPPTPIGTISHDPFVKHDAPNTQPKERYFNIITTMEEFEVPFADGVSLIQTEPSDSKRYAAVQDMVKGGKARAGDAVDRDVLLNQCWGMDYFPDSRTLDQTIAKLRKKIEADVLNPRIIETVRGVGYRFPLRAA